MRPSIMSEGAMMSAPASASTRACFASIATVSSLAMTPSRKQPVMAVAGIGIERDVAQDADLRHRLLDGAHRATDQIFGVERLGPVVIAQVGIGIGKQRQAGNLRAWRHARPPVPLRRSRAARRPAWRRPGCGYRPPRTAARSGRRPSARSRATGDASSRPCGCGAGGPRDRGGTRDGAGAPTRADPGFRLERTAVFDSH